MSTAQNRRRYCRWLRCPAKLGSVRAQGAGRMSQMGSIATHHDVRAMSACVPWIGIGGEPRGSAPPTPPYVRVRIRRFEKLR
jgi:hypothetical protein